MAIDRICELVGGLVLACAVLADIFGTLLVPGPAAGRPSVVLNMRTIGLFVWRRWTGRRGRMGQLGRRFAPLILVLSYCVWMLLLMVGFGLMLLALGDQFDPNVTTAREAFYVAGSSLVTLGVSEVNATGLTRWLVLAAGLSGFSVVTATITFSLQIQTGLHQRETGVLTLAGLAGTPPSGIAILETYAELSDRAELSRFLQNWRAWAAAVLHSHTSFPVLAYFSSTDSDNDWLAALEAVLDAATLLAAFTTHEACGSATLMHRTGAMVITRLRRMSRLDAGVYDDADHAAALIDRLQAAGFELGDPALGAERFGRMRADYAGDVAALAAHLGNARAVLLPVAQGHG